MIWAQDTNAYVCSTVMPDGVAATESVDLGGDYYTAAIPIVELQIAKAGYRWVNFGVWVNFADYSVDLRHG